MNKQGIGKIGWCTTTWNPVTGCLNGCEYCYARKIANRFGGYSDAGYNPCKITISGDNLYSLSEPVRNDTEPYVIAPYPFGFDPTFHRYRLSEPKQIKKPQNIFVCSMADLFGEWVPDEWIQAVFNACNAAPWHRYLFLTKNPERYSDIRTNKAKSINISRTLRNQIWLGATVTNQSQYNKAATALEDADVTVSSFLSIEPILESIEVTEMDCFVNWVIIGAETGNRKGKVIPEKSWIDDIASECQKQNIPIFMKESLRQIMGTDFVQKYPWTREGEQK